MVSLVERRRLICRLCRCGVLGVKVDKAKPALRIVRVEADAPVSDREFVVAVPAARPLVFPCGIAPFILRLEEPAGLIIRPTALLIVGFHNKDALIVG